MAESGVDAQREALIEQFTTITGANSERARFYLEAAGWNFSVATNSFFEEDLEDVEESEPVQETGEEGGGGDKEELVPAADEPEPSPAQPPPPSFSSSSRDKRTGIASMAEYQRRRREEEEGRAGREGEPQKFFAGGSEHSGQLISGPPRKKKVDAKELASDVFAAAKNQGARSVEEEESERVKEKSKVFRGAGFRLGDTEEASPQVQGEQRAKEPKKVTHTLTFWTNGFCVDNGPLRNGETPQDRLFLQSVSKGEIPQELIQSAKGGEVDVNIEDMRNEQYRARAPKMVAFFGEGHKLGSIAPELVSHSSAFQATPTTAPPGPSSPAAAPPSFPLDPSQPTTSVQIRLADGTRLVAKFNPSHTVNDIRQFINLSCPAMSSAHYILMTTFPNKELTDLSQSLADAKLLNSVVVQRMK